MKIKFLIVLLILVSGNVFLVRSQNPIRVELSGGSSLNLLRDDRVFSNWGSGFLIGGGAAYQLFPHFDLAMNVVYHRLPFKGGNIELNTLDILGYRISVNGGSPSDIFEWAISFRTSPEEKGFSPLFSIQTGMLRTRTGEITIRQWYDSNPGDITYLKYHDTGITETSLFSALGLGFSFPLWERSRIILEGRVIQTFDLKQTLFPIVFTLQHDFKKR